jgi:YD repeat-containing protein
VVTTLTYDARQRLTSSKVGTETTTYTYWPTGQLERITRPDSSTVTYTYDTSHRLTQITDGLGNTINYTLDAAGNRVAIKACDSNGNLKRLHTAAYNTLSSLYQDISAAGTSAVTTTYGYDAQGNQISVAAPLSRTSSNAFDALNRLTQITDAASGVTKFAYDGNDNPVSVVDPKNFTTAYAVDGFGEVTQLVSPDPARPSRPSIPRVTSRPRPMRWMISQRIPTMRSIARR